MYSSGELVTDFLRYKLSQRGHNWRWLCEQNGAAGLGTQPEPGAAVYSGRPEAERARQALLDAAEEFELRYRRAFSDLSAQLRVTPDTAYQRFEQVVGELFRDGVNWGRLVAFFCFGAALSVESAEKEMGALVPRIADWMSTYLEDNLEPWIQQHGGWVIMEQLCLHWSNNVIIRSRGFLATLRMFPVCSENYTDLNWSKLGILILEMMLLYNCMGIMLLLGTVSCRSLL
ncbi:apoptosis regulator R11-like isoform X2 [Chiloscyllium plagiosum]|uniref:apoptosis regulator R11-like isoform X2 n=1 Tax=Chiloscyllium plagiosum TaxID=36176 RepID=UPI001CB815A0|nr:apoptosis regulator R11-like isoform X2 [Chiloscyllium plagiosum]